MEALRVLIGLCLFISNFGDADAQYLSDSDVQVLEGIFGQHERFVSILSPDASNDASMKVDQIPTDATLQTRLVVKYNGVKNALPKESQGDTSVDKDIPTEPNMNGNHVEEVTPPLHDNTFPVLRESQRNVVKTETQRIRQVKNNENRKQMPHDVTEIPTVKPPKYASPLIESDYNIDLTTRSSNRYENPDQLPTTQAADSHKDHLSNKTNLHRIQPAKDNETSWLMQDIITEKPYVSKGNLAFPVMASDYDVGLNTRFERSDQLPSTQTAYSNKDHLPDNASIHPMQTVKDNEKSSKTRDSITEKSTAEPHRYVTPMMDMTYPKMASDYNIDLTNRFENPDPQPMTQPTNFDKEHSSVNPNIKQLLDGNNASVGSSVPKNPLLDTSGSRWPHMFILLTPFMTERRHQTNMVDVHKELPQNTADQFLQPMKVLGERKTMPKYGLPGLISMIPMTTLRSDHLSPITLIVIGNFGYATNDASTSTKSANDGITLANKWVDPISKDASTNTKTAIDGITPAKEWVDPITKGRSTRTKAADSGDATAKEWVDSITKGASTSTKTANDGITPAKEWVDPITKDVSTSIQTEDSAQVTAKEWVDPITRGPSDNAVSESNNVKSTDKPPHTDHVSGERNRKEPQESTLLIALVTRSEYSTETVGDTDQVGNKREQTSITTTEQINTKRSTEGTIVYAKAKPNQGGQHVKHAPRYPVEVVARRNNTAKNLSGFERQKAHIPSTTLLPILILDSDYGRRSNIINEVLDKPMLLQESHQPKTHAKSLMQQKVPKSPDINEKGNNNMERRNVATQVVIRTQDVDTVTQTGSTNQYGNNVEGSYIAMEQMQQNETTEQKRPSVVLRRLFPSYMEHVKQDVNVVTRAANHEDSDKLQPRQLPTVVVRQLPGPNEANYKPHVRDHVKVITRTADTRSLKQLKRNKTQGQLPKLVVHRLVDPSVANNRLTTDHQVNVITRTARHKHRDTLEQILPSMEQRQLSSVVERQNVVQNKLNERYNANIVTRASLTKSARQKHSNTFKSSRRLIDRRAKPIVQTNVIIRDHAQSVRNTHRDTDVTQLRRRFISRRTKPVAPSRPRMRTNSNRKTSLTGRVSRRNSYPRVGKGLKSRMGLPRSDNRFKSRSLNVSTSRGNGGRGTTQTSKPKVMVLDNNIWIPHRTHKMFSRRRG